METVKFKLIKEGKLPQYKTEGAACCDCYARLDSESGSFVIIAPRERVLIPLGFAMALPQGYEAVIRPRSGLMKKGIDQQIGTIDCDYRGEVSACLVNNTNEPYVVYDGERICQMKIQKAERFIFEVCDSLNKTERGEGGFGSTGLK